MKKFLKNIWRKFISQKKWLIAIEMIMLVLLIAGCIYLLLPKNKTVIKPPKEEPKIEEKKVQIVDVNTKSRPYAVMINNISTARPLQSGLQDAYIMYELIVEGGITRYLALFLDADTERIGSIRSARHYFLDYALENDAIYVHHGQSPQAQSDFSALKLDRIVVDNTKTGWRDKSLKVASEHTLFTSIEKLGNGIGKKRTERNNDLLLTYSAESLDLASIEGATAVNEIGIRYSRSNVSSYTYNDAEKVYYRSVNGKAHTDYVTGKQYTFKNIITYKVANSGITGDDKGRQDIRNVGSGEGYYISEGYAVPITWSKECRSCQTEYKLKNGDELVVNDGNTFIQIQPSGQDLSLS